MKIFNKDFLIDLQKCILWQYDKAEKLKSIINQKQEWYKINVTDFIKDFFYNIFSLKTANDFGLNIWGKLLNFPRQVFLNKYQITVEQTEGTDLTNIEVSRTTFNSKIESGDDFTAVTIAPEDLYTFIFTYDGSNWDITGSVSASGVDIATYGITYEGIPVENDQITVTADYKAVNLTTEQYRFLLLGQILKFRMNCTIPEINRYLRIIFNQDNNENVYVTDNHNMTITYTINPPILSNDIVKLINNYDFLPAPAGVLISTNATNRVTITFIRNSSDYIYNVLIDGVSYIIDGELTQSIDVEYGSIIDWSTGGTNVIPKTGIFTATENTTISTTCYNLIIKAYPLNATIKFTINGQEYLNNPTVVPGSYVQNNAIVTTNTAVTYSVELDGYVTESDIIVMTQNKTFSFDLQRKKIESIAKTNNYSSYPIIGLIETTIRKTGIYRITLKGEQGNNSIPYPGGTTIQRNGKGGILICDFNLTQGQVVIAQRIRGGRAIIRQYADATYCGGAGVSCLIDNDLKLVAGGGGGYAQNPSSGSNPGTVWAIGGGGHIGGSGNSSINGEYDGRGYSIDGTVGSNTTTDTNTAQGADYTISGKTGHGGTAFVKTGLIPSQVTYGANEGDGYCSIEYIS